MTDLLYELIYVLTVAMGGVSLLAWNYGLEKTGFLMILCGLIVAGIAVAFRRSKLNGRLIIIGIFVMILATGFFLSRNDSVNEFFSENDYYLWVPFVGLLAFILGEIICRIRMAKLVVSLLSLGWLIVCTALGFRTEKIFVAATLLLLLLTFVEEVQLRWNKTGFTEHKGHVVYVAPFIILSFVLILVSPAPKNPYDWNFAKKIYQAARDKIEELDIRFSIGKAGDSAEKLIGFSDRGLLADEAGKEEKDVMILSNVNSTIGMIKLTGKTFSTFDGREWSDEDDSLAPDVIMDTVGMWASVNDYTDKTQNLALRTDMKVEFVRMKTNHPFVPLKTVPTVKDLATGEYSQVGGDLMWPESKAYESKYFVSYYRLNTGNSIFKEYLRDGKVPTKESYLESEYKLNTDRIENCGYEDYLAHVNHIKDTYGKTVVLSPKLREFMDKVYSGAESDVDKIDRLEELLRSFTYSETPGELPDGIKNESDFLDYFVLESRKGFCSHFATAFVLLARAEGIPARYAQGYIVYPKGKREITVKSSWAHAWPEVYYDNAGWIAYEPTPAYVNNSYWETEEGTPVQKVQAAPGYNASAYENLTDLTEENETVRIRIKWYTIVIPMIMGMVFISLVFFIVNMIMARRFEKMREEDKFVALCRQNIRILRLSGKAMGDNETLHEYRERLLENDGTEDFSFLEGYEKYWYRGDIEKDSAVKGATLTKQKLLSALKRANVLKYIRFYMGFN
ncbi:MAG: transglutaminase domain-containing protein [Lachnospiraceae bacterium]|nr:transglutaminase domain-containing protein [Lachnospiraceae bacterium]